MEEESEGQAKGLKRSGSPMKQDERVFKKIKKKWPSKIENKAESHEK